MEYHDRRKPRVLPTSDAISKARIALVSTLPQRGKGTEAAIQHVRDELAPAFNAASQSPNYYGFVTGGITRAAALSDNLVTEYDQNVQVHLPNETIATEVEDAALKMLCQLLRLDVNEWKHRTFTTGATASNILGLACGREYVIRRRSLTHGTEASVGKIGLMRAMNEARISSIRILTSMAHSSLRKAASLVGFGRDAVLDVGRKASPVKFDLDELERRLKESEHAHIVVVSCGEVNTGGFATSGEEMRHIRKLCDEYNAWIHVDGAFGVMGRMLETLDGSQQYSRIVSSSEGIELADSVTGDGHKLLNVPYDCGFFFSRDPKTAIDVFQNTGAAYLNSGSTGDDVISPLHIGIENSRRFRALPVYATLIAYGVEGYRDMLKRQIDLARSIAKVIIDHPAYELLPTNQHAKLEEIFVIVLFRAFDMQLNSNLVRLINETGEIYVSGTQWDGQPAARFAVSNWQADVARDALLVKQVLDEVSRVHG